MEWNQIVFLIWCMGIHCMLWALMDPSTRNGIIFAWNKLRYVYLNLN